MQPRPIWCAVLASFLVFFTGVGGAQAPNPRSPDREAMRALWEGIKRQLNGPNGVEYFRSVLERSNLPPLRGTLVAATPAQHPTTLVLSLSDGATPEVTLRFKSGSGQEDSFTGPLPIGSRVQFSGTPVTFTQNPFMLTFEVSASPAQQ